MTGTYILLGHFTEYWKHFPWFFLEHYLRVKFILHLFVKTARKGAVLWWQAGHFYSRGAAFWNDLSSAYFSNIRGTCNRCWSLYLNCLGTIFWDRNQDRYNGAILWRALHVKHNALISILSCVGNQWSWWRTGVICSHCLVSVIILAAVFCVLWMYWSWPCATQYKMEFSASRCEQMHEQLYLLPPYPEMFWLCLSSSTEYSGLYLKFCKIISN